MNILLIHNYYHWRGGEGISMSMEAGALREAGHQVDYFTMDNAVDLQRIGRLHAAARSIWSVNAYSAIRAKIRAMKADIVHVNNFFPLISPAVFAAARKAGVPSVQSLRNYRYFCPATSLFRDGHICTECADGFSLRPAVRYRCYRGSLPGSVVSCASLTLQRRASWLPDAAIAISRFVHDRYREQGWPAERVFVKPNTVWPVPDAGKGGECFVVAGRLADDKGLDIVIDAWSRIARSGASAPVLRIFGDGPMRESLAAEVRRLGLDDVVIFEGQRSFEETSEAIANARALVFPSVRYEPFGRPVVEAFALGTPVLASDIGGPGELVRNGETGFLVPPGDAVALAERVKEMQSCDLDAMRRVCRKEFDDLYAPSQNVAVLLGIYEQASHLARGKWKWRLPSGKAS